MRVAPGSKGPSLVLRTSDMLGARIGVLPMSWMTASRSEQVPRGAPSASGASPSGGTMATSVSAHTQPVSQPKATDKSS